MKYYYYYYYYKKDFKAVVSGEIVRSQQPKSWSFVWGPIHNGHSMLTRKTKMHADDFLMKDKE